MFTAVNNGTGELMAMKEISLQTDDHRTMRGVADELRILEGTRHRHLVRHYGVEIHRDEMIIFMEFCPEGTLQNLASSTEAGLPEELIRRFTRQLLDAVAVLHDKGIVHRDIKSISISIPLLTIVEEPVFLLARLFIHRSDHLGGPVQFAKITKISLAISDSPVPKLVR